MKTVQSTLAITYSHERAVSDAMALLIHAESVVTLVHLAGTAIFHNNCADEMDGAAIQAGADLLKKQLANARTLLDEYLAEESRRIYGIKEGGSPASDAVNGAGEA